MLNSNSAIINNCIRLTNLSETNRTQINKISVSKDGLLYEPLRYNIMISIHKYFLNFIWSINVELPIFSKNIGMTIK